MFLNAAREKRERIIALDLLRGAFLLVIFVNHIQWSPTLFDFITGQSHLFASAAEGFFAISGILVGYIYGPRVLKYTKSTFIKLWRRAGWLYLLSISFTILYSTITLFLPPETVRGQFLYGNFTDFLFNTFTLQFSYGWADFLSRYALLMAFSPFVIWLVAKNKTWIVAIISIIAWLTQPLFHIDFLAWQIIFYFAIVIGFYLPQIERSVGAWPRSTKKNAQFLLYLTAAISFVISIIMTVTLPIIAGEFKNSLSPNFLHFILAVIDLNTQLNQTIFNRDSMSIGRIFIGILWFTTLYCLFRKYETRIDEKTKGSLLLLGTNSLYVYGLQSFIIFMVDIFFDPPKSSNVITKTLFVAILIYLVYLLTRQRSHFRRVRMRMINLWKWS